MVVSVFWFECLIFVESMNDREGRLDIGVTEML